MRLTKRQRRNRAIAAARERLIRQRGYLHSLLDWVPDRGWTIDPACRRSPHWEPYHLSLHLRGLTTTFVGLGRKLALMCFALSRHGTDFSRDITLGCCRST